MLKNNLKELFAYLLLISLQLFVIARILMAHFFAVKIESGSMLPSYDYPHSVNVRKNYYHKHDIVRGDPVMFMHNRHCYCKRAIGIPGDIIKMEGGILTINGNRIGEGLRPVYVHHKHIPELGVVSTREHYGDRVVHVLYDESTVARENWCAQVPKDHYFMMGDNRGRSADSRSLFGFIHKDFIFIKVLDQDSPNSDINDQLDSHYYV